MLISDWSDLLHEVFEIFAKKYGMPQFFHSLIFLRLNTSIYICIVFDAKLRCLCIQKKLGTKHVLEWFSPNLMQRLMKYEIKFCEFQWLNFIISCYNFLYFIHLVKVCICWQIHFILSKWGLNFLYCSEKWGRKISQQVLLTQETQLLSVHFCPKRTQYFSQINSIFCLFVTSIYFETTG